MAQKTCFPSRRKYAPKFGYFPSVSDIYILIAIFRLALMVPPIECDLGYRFASRTLPNLNPNPKADPDPLAPEPIRQTRPKPYHFFRWYGSQCKCRTTFQAHEFTHHVSDSESQQTKLTNLLSIMPGAVASCTRIVCYGYLFIYSVYRTPSPLCLYCSNCTKFGRLILTKFLKIVASRCVS